MNKALKESIANIKIVSFCNDPYAEEGGHSTRSDDEKHMVPR